MAERDHKENERLWLCPNCGAANRDFGPNHPDQPTVEPVCGECNVEYWWTDFGWHDLIAADKEATQ